VTSLQVLHARLAEARARDAATPTVEVPQPAGVAGS
jgi:hypothetical protein